MIPIVDWPRRSLAICGCTPAASEFREKVEAVDAETEALWLQIAEDMEAAAPEFDPADLPAPRLPDPPQAPLFNCLRDYLDQIDAYRAWPGKGEAA